MVGAGVVSSGGKLYVLDGSTGNGIEPPLQIYDPAPGTWTIKAPDPVYRAAVSVGVINNKIHIAEGSLNSDSNNPTRWRFFAFKTGRIEFVL